jgi:RNA-directed DNA polymerase
VRPKVNVIRYADYIIITRGKKEILNLIRTILEEFLAVQGLNLKEAKIRVTHIDEGFNFIGYNIQRRPINRKFNKMNLNKDKVLIIQPTKKAIESIKRKIKNSILIKHPIERVIKNLNPVLRE